MKKIKKHKNSIQIFILGLITGMIVVILTPYIDSFMFALSPHPHIEFSISRGIDYELVNHSIDVDNLNYFAFHVEEYPHALHEQLVLADNIDEESHTDVPVYYDTGQIEKCPSCTFYWIRIRNIGEAEAKQIEFDLYGVNSEINVFEKDLRAKCETNVGKSLFTQNGISCIINNLETKDNPIVIGFSTKEKSDVSLDCWVDDIPELFCKRRVTDLYYKDVPLERKEYVGDIVVDMPYIPYKPGNWTVCKTYKETSREWEDVEHCKTSIEKKS